MRSNLKISRVCSLLLKQVSCSIIQRRLRYSKTKIIKSPSQVKSHQVKARPNASRYSDRIGTLISLAFQINSKRWMMRLTLTISMGLGIESNSKLPRRLLEVVVNLRVLLCLVKSMETVEGFILKMLLKVFS